jgi:GT2 family glycosyltransferase
MERLTSSLNAHTRDFELIVVDDPTLGFNEAMNEGVRRAKGRYYAFLHDDIEVMPGWADRLVALGAFHVGEIKDTIQIQGGYYTPVEKYAAVGEWPQYTAFFQVRKDIFKKIGWFDEAYKRPGYQDVDYGLQAEKAGFAFVPLEGKVIHWHSPIERVMTDSNKVYLHEKWGI